MRSGGARRSSVGHLPAPRASRAGLPRKCAEVPGRTVRVWTYGSPRRLAARRALPRCYVLEGKRDRAGSCRATASNGVSLALALTSTPPMASMQSDTLTPDLLRAMDAYWRAANYLSVGQMYLSDNPLLKRPLGPGDVKHMLLGHWGTTPGQNFIYVHLNRVIVKY